MNDRITAITIIFLLALPCGCFSQHQVEVATPATRHAYPTPKRAETTTPRKNSEQNEGVMDTTGNVIGDVVLFPFRALGEALTPGQAE
jgi:hypothetical protein